MTEQGKEERLIEEVARDLYEWVGGGFNTQERMAIARDRAVRLISKVRRVT